MPFIIWSLNLSQLNPFHGQQRHWLTALQNIGDLMFLIIFIQFQRFVISVKFSIYSEILSYFTLSLKETTSIIFYLSEQICFIRVSAVIFHDLFINLPKKKFVSLK